MDSALERLQDLLERATSGPWVRHGRDVEAYDAATDRDMHIYDEGGHSEDDARLIALAPVLASDLIALAEAVDSVIAGMDRLGQQPDPDAIYGALGGLVHVLDTALSAVLAHIDEAVKE